ncbi:SIMPL domain-containing protein [Glaciihabitans sp. UYNi722]|uniref:SIMPL domain-containing protein n=1 Tax=Glaciihabitans sp. UYNi722 TaxID=3156344 RepID=UPI0033979D1B
MTDTIITVHGRFSAFYPAERATVVVTIHLEGAQRNSVFAAVTTSADSLRREIVTRHSPSNGPITWWSSDAVQVWSEKPWNKDGKQLAPVFHARIGFTAKFSDFTELSAWVERVAAISGVSVGGIDWDLTEARKNGVTAEVRSRAVKDAVAKASVYAQSIGLGSVRAIAIADPGMLGDQVGSAASAPQSYGSMRMASATDSAAPALSLKPEDIEVNAVVDARFVAS